MSSSSNLRYLAGSTEKLRLTGEKLASGKRINTASDDPAGLAIAEKLRTDAAISQVGRSNISYATSANAIASGAISSVTDITGRLQELAAQSANGTFSDTQRGAIAQEFGQLQEELVRIVGTTEFNGTKLLTQGNIDVQAGADPLTGAKADLTQYVATVSSLNVSDQASAVNALQSLSDSFNNLSQATSSIGAFQSRLDVADKVLEVDRTERLAAESRIRDLDYAEATANHVKNSILQQAGVAVESHSKINQQIVLKLLS